MQPNFLEWVSSGTLSSSSDLNQLDGRLFVAYAMYEISRCKAAEGQGCTKTPELPRTYWLNGLMNAGILLTCFQEDAESLSDDDRQFWSEVEKNLPQETRLHDIAWAMSELGIEPEDMGM